MASSRFSWRLFLSNALLTAAVWGALIWLIVSQVESFYRADLTRQLTVQAELLSRLVAGKLTTAHAAELDALAKEVGGLPDAEFRVTFLGREGAVLGDSLASPATMESYADRVEVQQALRDGVGVSNRWSRTVDRAMHYVAVRVGDAASPQGVVRVATPQPVSGLRTKPALRFIWTVTFLAVAAAIVFAFGLARLWSGPLGRLSATARSLSQGDLSARVDVSGSDQLALLGRSLNQMRDHLAAQLDTIDRQRRTQESLLAQLHEGVVAATADGRIALINPAARQLLDLSWTGGRDGAAEGMPVEQCIPQHDLQRMLLAPARTTKSDPLSADGAAKSASGEAAIQEVRIDVEGGNGVVSLLARASDIVLPTAGARSGRPANGRLLVLTDITELTRTLQVKTDFVANASHELRTPLSAIRAAVETLLKMDMEKEAGPAKLFINVVNRHSARLEALVADLLDLSRVESPAAPVQPTTVYLPEVFSELHERFEGALSAKGLAWQVECPPEYTKLVAAPHLLRLMLDNLIDNAIKFTDAGSVRIACSRDAASFRIEVSDSGCGIPKEETQRVFERFYQVERSRSGTGSPQAAIRGTGLGLSIVRHAVMALGGVVELSSEPGQGTRVTVSIPQPNGAT